MSSEEFAGLDFAVGSVTGLRRWRINDQGVLRAFTYQQDVWTTGVNTAVCHCFPSTTYVPAYTEGTDPGEWLGLVAAWKKNHAMQEGSHGFYAYFDQEKHQYGSSSPTVAGVIEGFGEVLIGTKGFRCMKARILALTVAPFDGAWSLHPIVVSRLRQNYPDVPVFSSIDTMLSEFPTSKVSELVPEQVA